MLFTILIDFVSVKILWRFSPLLSVSACVCVFLVCCYLATLQSRSRVCDAFDRGDAAHARFSCAKSDAWKLKK